MTIVQQRTQTTAYGHHLAHKSPLAALHGFGKRIQWLNSPSDQESSLNSSKSFIRSFKTISLKILKQNPAK